MKGLILSLSILMVCLPAARLSGATVDHSGIVSMQQCLECHPRVLPTHALGVKINNRSGLPVAEQGGVTCLTCHACESGTCTVRDGGPEALCSACHDCTQGMACVLQIAHMGNSRSALKGSSLCLGCHDGTEGRLVDVRRGHKVEVLYLASSRFNPIRDDSVILVNGRVTCLSCHNPYKNSRERLVRSNQGSGLCLTCHRK